MKEKRYVAMTLMAIALLAACTGSEPAIDSPAIVSGPAAAESVMDTPMDEVAVETEEMPADEMDHNMADEPAPPVDEATMEGHAPAMQDSTAAMSDEGMESEAEAMGDMVELPVWQQLPLADARTGETFTLADYAGKTVFVEPMATWCTNCRRQLFNVMEARGQLGDENAIFVALSLETNLDGQALAQYADGNGFDWTFAVMSPEILQALADQFGRSITSAPSTPHFVIRPDGSYTDLVTGIDSPDQIVQMIQAARG